MSSTTIDDRAVAELFPENDRLHRWLEMAQERVAFQGLPARICWLGYGERARAGLRFNEMVASGELSAPIVTAPITTASGWTYAVGSMSGTWSPSA